MKRRYPLWLVALACAWFAIGAAYHLYRGLPQMVQEWNTFAGIHDDTAKRDKLFPGWLECVTVARQKIPPGGDMVFISDVDEERYSYLNYLLNYELYPLRHFHKVEYGYGIRPRFVLIYLGVPAGMKFEQYRPVYATANATLLERR